MKFSDLGLVPAILEAVAREGYTEPTPIQVKAIPPALGGRDVLGCAQTGTGKTAAFALPMLQRLDASASDEVRLRGLIVTPTRELATQIGTSLTAYGEGLDLYHTVIFGGVSEKPQIAELREGIDILVATPGRLLDLMRQNALHLRDVEYFVLDEADRMLDMGFLPDVKRIIAALPKQRQSMFFSATMPPDIRALADSLLINPVSVAVAPPATTAERIEQRVYFVDGKAKTAMLVELLRDPALSRVLVFTQMKHGANRLVEKLAKAGIPSAAIHGNKSQNARDRAMNGFRDGSLRILVATDLAARGIDVDGLSHVINYDLPNVPETYVHRIGRTGRAGAAGIAISFCGRDERAYLADIEKLTRVKVDRVEDELLQRVLASLPAGQESAPEDDDRGPRHGGRHGGRRGDNRGRGHGGHSGPQITVRQSPATGHASSHGHGGGASHGPVHGGDHAAPSARGQGTRAGGGGHGGGGHGGGGHGGGGHGGGGRGGG
ncbi:MAG: DEAD/DEAH box helicase, partial [Sandaracinaceae bacterium]|nr:DEAD/DEAH box helicase [Sandaracinaceae bacterium]